MTDTPRTGLEFVDAGTLDIDQPVNNNALALDAVVGMNVVSATTTAQPTLSSPADNGKVYILPSGKTGTNWGPRAVGDIAQFYSGTWYFYTPWAGLMARAADSGIVYQFTTAWAVWASVFGQSLLNDSDAAAARATLEVDEAGAAQNAYNAAADLIAASIDAITPETIGMAAGYDLTTGNRLTNIDTVFGSHPMFFSAASTATGLPAAVSGQGAFIPFSSTAGMMFYTSASATDANRRMWFRQGSGSAWGSWIELGFRYWNGTTAASGNVSPNLDLHDSVIRTALAAAVTINNPTGTKINGRKLVIRLRDNGTGRAITWQSEYRSMTATLPATTTANKTLYCEFYVNADETTLDLMNVQVQP